MRRPVLATAAALLAVLAGGLPAGAGPDGTSGGIKVTVHTHSSNPATLLFPEVERLAFDFAEGDTFAYSSRLCSANAAFNNLGLDFRPDFAGVDDDGDGTASVRHQVTGTVTEVREDGTGVIEGTITTVLCEGGEATASSIVSHYVADYEAVSDDLMVLEGRFHISPTESTGIFAGLEGQGSLRGNLTCLREAVCADVGSFTDFVGARGDLSRGPGDIRPGLTGTYSI
ncbi:MAG TPA: hypothetical protein VFO65_09420 [Acidimicrobiales bacterium]|nr:hypothetical protein [Acidimicrobiales bacterium]